MCSGRPARRAIAIASLGPLSGLARPMYTSARFLVGAELVRRQVDAVVHGARVRHVEVGGALRVADRDEVHVLREQRVEQPVLIGPRTVQRVHDRRSRPAAARRRSARRCRNDRARCRIRSPAGTTRARDSASYQGLPSSCGSGGSDIGDTSAALVREPPDAKSVTSWPASTRPSASSETTSSIPPYPVGGTANHTGAMTATRIVRRLMRRGVVTRNG